MQTDLVHQLLTQFNSEYILRRFFLWLKYYIKHLYPKSDRTERIVVIGTVQIFARFFSSLLLSTFFERSIYQYYFTFWPLILIFPVRPDFTNCDELFLANSWSKPDGFFAFLDGLVSRVIHEHWVQNLEFWGGYNSIYIIEICNKKHTL